MRKKIWNIVKYILSLSLAIALMVYAFQGISLQKVWEESKQANFFWVFVSMLFGTLSHLSRAYRWNMLLNPLGYEPTLYKSFLSVMNGYFINLVIPRAGEVSRCGFMQRMEKVPISTSLGTIVLERLIDVLMLLTLIIGLLLVEFNNYASFFADMLSSKVSFVYDLPWTFIIIATIILSVILGILIYNFRSFIQQSMLYVKTRDFLKKLLEGILSIRKVKNKPAFFFHTVFIWLMYYCMAYVLLFSFEKTADLGLWAGYVLLIMGAIGMAAPVQGGFGVYHALVSTLLMTYGLTKEEGVVVATFLHTAQTLLVVVLGGASLIISSIIVQKTQKNAKNTEQALQLEGSPSKS